jgi:glycosyltransferase involved in cell wall biosynthesis
MTGQEKIMCLAVGDVLLNPGLVGLVILDSFCAGLPMITTDCGIHSPEIAYLDNWKNGVMTANSVAHFVDAAASVLTRPDQLEELRAGCRTSAELYSIDNMAKNFSDGILQALSSPRSGSISRNCA